MKKKLKDKILIVCHDAGGAEIISAYAKKHQALFDFHYCIAGPAVSIFKRKKIKSFKICDRKQAEKLIRANQKLNLVLANVGWGSAVELDLIQVAKKNNTRTAVYLDHWVNYRERFGYPRKKWTGNLPDEFWAGDKHALDLANKFFKGKSIKFVPNLYYKEIKNEYAKARKRTKGGAENILFMSEPISATCNCFNKKSTYGFNELEVLEDLLRYAANKNIKNNIIICFHPSEKRDKFDKLISKYSDRLNILKQSGNLLDDFSRSFLIIGMMGMILELASNCGRRTVSFIPNKKVHCPLPNDNIIKIRKIKELDGLLFNKEKIIAIIQARMGSSRLPGKAMIKIRNKPILQYVLDRVRLSNYIGKIYLATTKDKKNNILISWANKNKIKYYQGSETDVLNSFYQIAKQAKAEAIVRITGDCPLADYKIIDKVIRAFSKKRCDYASNTQPPTYPDGLDAEIFTFNALKKAWKESKLNSERQHVTPYIWKHPEIFKLANVKNSRNLSGYRWTLDTPADLNLIKRIIEKGEQSHKYYGLEEILQILKNNPEWLKINNKLKRNEGYAKSLKEDKISI